MACSWRRPRARARRTRASRQRWRSRSQAVQARPARRTARALAVHGAPVNIRVNAISPTAHSRLFPTSGLSDREPGQQRPWPGRTPAQEDAIVLVGSGHTGEHGSPAVTPPPDAPYERPMPPCGRDRGEHRQSAGPATRPGYGRLRPSLPGAARIRRVPPAVSAKPLTPGPKRVYPGRTFLICAAGTAGAHERPDVPGTGRSRKCPADSPLRAEPAASTTTREIPCRHHRTWTILLGRPCPAQPTHGELGHGCGAPKRDVDG